MVVFAVIYMVLAFIPFVGSLLSFLAGPIFGAGPIGCRAIEEGTEFKHLFKGFSQRWAARPPSALPRVLDRHHPRRRW